MTITATFALQNVPINADTVRQAIASLLPNGAGGIVQTGDFAVTQTGTPSMGVSVGVGRAWIEGTDVAHLAGQNYGKQGKYFILNDAAYPVTIATANNTNPRIDVIYAAIQDAAYAGSNNQPVIAVATGIPTSGATYPANATALPTNAIPLAWINVAANATSILNASITTIANAITAPPLGEISRTSITSNVAVPTSGGAVIISTSFYALANRRLRFTVDLNTSAATAGQYIEWDLKQGTTGGLGDTTIRQFTKAYAGTATSESISFNAYYNTTTAGTLKATLAAAMAIGTGGGTAYGSGTNPITISVVDCGAV